jgi:predicted DNA-binding transcriptional regulator YafY
MTRTTKRSTRLKEIEEFLLAKRGQVPTRTLWEHFGTNRSTIYRCLLDLETEWDVPIIREPAGTVSIVCQRYLTNVRLNLNEAATVFVAARLLARYSDKPNPNAVGALRKLSIALQHVAPQMAQTSEHLDRTLSDQSCFRLLLYRTGRWNQNKSCLRRGVLITRSYRGRPTQFPIDLAGQPL